MASVFVFSLQHAQQRVARMFLVKLSFLLKVGGLKNVLGWDWSSLGSLVLCLSECCWGELASQAPLPSSFDMLGQLESIVQGWLLIA